MSRSRCAGRTTARRIYFQWKKYSDKIIAPMDTYAIGRDGSNLRKLSDEEIQALPPGAGRHDAMISAFMAYSNAGDLYVFDNTSGKIQQLTKTTDIEVNPHFTHDGKRVSFTRGGNLYVMSLDSGMLVQFTDIRAPAAPEATAAAAAGGRGGGARGGRGGAPVAGIAAPEPRGTDSQEYLKKEQRELLGVVRERVELRDELQKEAASRMTRKPFTLQARQSAGPAATFAR